MTDPLAACPYTKRGRHDIAVITNDEPDGPVLLVCLSCGTSRREAMTLPEPLDDFDAADIARIASDRG